ncbi:MAG: flagellar hook-basal body complex protein, partial [Fibrobacteres bacterium]|nr:flagellar hook-basal body complex protein [Fibrobacterota bacterium]
MIRSLYSAISGLRNHQVRLDVIGNNIANVNTTGFKSGRVTFEESMAQLLKGSSRPPGFQGGTNPIQVGLGMSVGSIDTITTQGNLESTGQITDLAIEGTSYFVVSNGNGNFYTRNGAFQFDSTGRMVLPTNGFVLQGKMAAEDGTFPVGTTTGDITIPFSSQAPAKESTEVKYQGNLNSDSEALGTIVYTQSFYHRANEFNTLGLGGASVNDNNFGAFAAGSSAHAAAALTFADIATDQGVLDSTPLTGLHNSKGESLLIKTGDVMKVTATINDGVNDETITASFEVIEDPLQAGIVGGSTTDYRVNTVQQMLLSMEHFLTGTAWRGGAGSNAADAHVAIMPDGQVRVANGAGSTQSIRNLTVSSDRPISRTYISSAFSFQSDIAVGSFSDSSSRLLRPAMSTDNLFNPMTYDNAGVSLSGAPTAQIFTSKGDLIDLEQGDKLQISALIGDVSRNASTLQTDVGTDVGTSTTMQQILTYIQDTLNLPERDGTIANNLSVSVNEVGTDDDLIPEGSIVVRGQPETAFGINNLSALATNNNPTTAAPSAFNSNMVVTQLQAARDTGVVDTSIEVYDESGAAHTLTIRFTHTGQKQPAVWNWEINTNNGEEILQGRTGQITFGTDGSPSSFVFSDSG